VAIQQTIDDPKLYELVGRGWDTEIERVSHPVPASRARTNTLRLDLLGSPQASLADRPIVLRTRKTLALLAYLALERGPHPREQLADLFWPDADIEDARASLRTTLSYVRQALEADADAIVLATRESIGLLPSASLELDVRELSEAQRLIRQSQGTGALRRQMETVVQQYRGPFLEGISLPDAPDFEAWMEGQRTHWRGVEEELLDRLATLQAHEGDAGAALTTLERWTWVNPDEESAWQRLVELHIRHEDSAGARRAWKAYREALAELDVEPSGGMTALAERIDGAASSQYSSVVRSSTESGDLDFRNMPFVGRAREWSLLLSAYDRSRTGRTEVVILEGEAGIGKTRLVSQFLQSVQSSGADVVVGRAFETVSDLPYAAVVEALRARLEEENAPDDLLGDLWLGELSRLVPELRERYPDLPVSADDPILGPGRLFEAVARLGQALAGRNPLVLCLDDVQWTDVATRDLVRYTVRRWAEGGTPVLVILTVRVENLRTEWEIARWLSGVERDTPTLRLELNALERRDVVQLVGMLAGYPLGVELVDGSEGHREGTRTDKVVGFGEWLADRTGGHPLYLAQALRVLLEEGVLRVRPAGDSGWAIDFPDTIEAEHDERLANLLLSRVQALIAERLNHLGEVDGELLVAAGVLSGRFTDQRLIEVASVDEDTGLRALDVLVRERLLRETGEDESYDFTHGLIREAVVAEAGTARRRIYQRRALVVLEHHAASPSDPVQQALAG